MPQGLLAYYKGDSFQGEDGTYYMRDCVGGNHASIQASGNPQVEDSPVLVNTPLKATLQADSVAEAYLGMPVTLTATRSEGVNKVWWSVPSCGITEKYGESISVVFTELGTIPLQYMLWIIRATHCPAKCRSRSRNLLLSILRSL